MEGGGFGCGGGCSGMMSPCLPGFLQQPPSQSMSVDSGARDTSTLWVTSWVKRGAPWPLGSPPSLAAVGRTPSFACPNQSASSHVHPFVCRCSNTILRLLLHDAQSSTKTLRGCPGGVDAFWFFYVPVWGMEP